MFLKYLKNWVVILTRSSCYFAAESKLALQHIFDLFKPSVIVTHKPNYKSTIDAAVYTMT